MSFVIGFLIIPIILGVFRLLGLYIIVQECESHVLVLFGKVLGSIDEPGLHFPVTRFGLQGLLVPFVGRIHCVSTALKQQLPEKSNGEFGRRYPNGGWYMV